MRAWSWSFAGRGWVTIFQFSGKKERDGLGPLRSDRLANGRARAATFHVREIETHGEEQPIEWTLAMTEPIATEADIERIVDAYRARWVIEEYFKAICRRARRKRAHADATGRPPRNQQKAAPSESNRARRHARCRRSRRAHQEQRRVRLGRPGPRLSQAARSRGRMDRCAQREKRSIMRSIPT